MFVSTAVFQHSVFLYHLHYTGSKDHAAELRQKISDSQAYAAEHYTPSYELQEGAVASQLMIMGTDDLIVSVMRCVTLPGDAGFVYVTLDHKT